MEVSREEIATMMANGRARGHRTALASFAVTVATLVGIVVVGVAVEATTAADLPERSSTTGWSVRLVRFAVLLGIPLVATGSALVMRGRTAAIVTRAVATVVLVVWSLLFVFSAIIGFLPAAALMAIATVQAIAASRSASDRMSAG